MPRKKCVKPASTPTRSRLPEQNLNDEDPRLERVEGLLFQIGWRAAVSSVVVAMSNWAGRKSGLRNTDRSSPGRSPNGSRMTGKLPDRPSDISHTSAPAKLDLANISTSAK